MKHVFSVVLCVMLIIESTVSVAAFEEYKGDVDGDGKVTTADARIVLQIASGIQPLTREYVKKCDVNGDRDISLVDACTILRMACNTVSLVPNEKYKEIVLTNMPVGTYTLKYEDLTGVISEYETICTINVLDDNEEFFYDGFISKNCAPVGAVCIGVYDSDNKRVAELALDTLLVDDLGEKLYSFAAISDTHIGVKTGAEDFQNALAYFESDSDIAFTTICGDLTHSGNEEQLSLFKSIVDKNTAKPVYGISGNHEALGPMTPLAMDALKPYTGQDLYYSFEYGDDVYIMLGIYGNSNYKQIFAPEELQWLYETLEANKNKRCFLFMHFFPWNGSGDAVNFYGKNDMDNIQGQVFYSLLSHYSNVVYFHGHSHAKFELQELNTMNNYDNIFGCHSVHIPSITSPTYGNGTGYSKDYNGSEGYIVDVYENNIILKGRDFITGRFLPIATYSLDTTIKSVDDDTYYDPTGTVLNENSNVLKSGDSWYDSTVDKRTITKISFVDHYDNAYDEYWDATIAQNNQVIVYRKGTELFVDCGEKGVNANMNSSGMFSDFSSLTDIEGFHMFDGSHICEIESMFKNCSSLKQLDLSGFNSVNPQNMKYVFYGCKSLEKIDISNFNLDGVNAFQNMCYDCSSLKNILLPNIDKSKTKYLTGTFGNCSSLECIDMTKFTGNVYYGSTFSGCASLRSVNFSETTPINVNDMFMDCISIETVDISTFDFTHITSFSQVFKNCESLEKVMLPSNLDTSKIVTMRSMFANCTNLTLDCSQWDTTSLTDITSFNDGAPNVIAPVISGVEV